MKSKGQLFMRPSHDHMSTFKAWVRSKGMFMMRYMDIDETSIYDTIRTLHCTISLNLNVFTCPEMGDSFRKQDMKTVPHVITFLSYIHSMIAWPVNPVSYLFITYESLVNWSVFQQGCLDFFVQHCLHGDFSWVHFTVLSQHSRPEPQSTKRF